MTAISSQRGAVSLRSDSEKKDQLIFTKTSVYRNLQNSQQILPPHPVLRNVIVGRLSPFFKSHAGPQDEQRYSSNLCQDLRHKMRLVGQPHIPAASTPCKDTVPILQEAGWAPRPVWTDGKSRPDRDSIPDRPARSTVTKPTELHGSRNLIVNAVNFLQPCIV